MREVEINKEPVELYKLLKFESLASSGGEAKFFISEGQVKLNGVVETRKRKKLVAGDIIEFQQEKIILKLNQGEDIKRGDVKSKGIKSKSVKRAAIKSAV